MITGLVVFPFWTIIIIKKKSIYSLQNLSKLIMLKRTLIHNITKSSSFSNFINSLCLPLLLIFFVNNNAFVYLHFLYSLSLIMVFVSPHNSYSLSTIVFVFLHCLYFVSNNDLCFPALPIFFVCNNGVCLAPLLILFIYLVSIFPFVFISKYY